MVLAEQTGTDPAIYYLHGLDLVAQSDGVTTEYFAYDGLGSVRQVADATGSPLLTQTFDPYGNLYARAGEGVTRFGFTGEYGDTNGLLYLRARYYAPSQGRFFGRKWMEGGGDISPLSDVLGHSQIHVTKHYYLRFDVENVRRQHRLHSPVAGLVD